MTGDRMSPSTRMTLATRQGLSVGLATGLYGISFGALAVASGLTWVQACALSLLMFTGGSQFAFIGILGAGGSGLAATTTAGLLGIRNSLYSLQLVPLLRGPRRSAVEVARRAAAAHLTIDESTAVSLAQDDPAEERRGFWVTGLGVFICWNLFTFIGAFATARTLQAGQDAGALADPKTWGLDGAAVAAFIALLWPRLKTRQARLVATLAALVAVALVPVTPAGVPVLAAAAAAAAVAALRPIAPRPAPATGDADSHEGATS